MNTSGNNCSLFIYRHFIIACLCANTYIHTPTSIIIYTVHPRWRYKDWKGRRKNVYYFESERGGTGKMKYEEIGRRRRVGWLDEGGKIESSRWGIDEYLGKGGRWKDRGGGGRVSHFISPSAGWTWSVRRWIHVSSCGRWSFCSLCWANTWTSPGPAEHSFLLLTSVYMIVKKQPPLQSLTEYVCYIVFLYHL